MNFYDKYRVYIEAIEFDRTLPNILATLLIKMFVSIDV